MEYNLTNNIPNKTQRMSGTSLNFIKSKTIKSPKNYYDFKFKSPEHKTQLSNNPTTRDRIINNFYNLIYEGYNPKVEELKSVLSEKDQLIKNLMNDKKQLQLEVKQLKKKLNKTKGTCEEDFPKKHPGTNLHTYKSMQSIYEVAPSLNLNNTNIQQSYFALNISKVKSQDGFTNNKTDRYSSTYDNTILHTDPGSSGDYLFTKIKQKQLKLPTKRNMVSNTETSANYVLTQETQHSEINTNNNCNTENNVIVNSSTLSSPNLEGLKERTKKLLDYYRDKFDSININSSCNKCNLNK
jgi:hypothetical protein